MDEKLYFPNKVFDEDFDQSTIFRIVAWCDGMSEAFYYYGGIFSEKFNVWNWNDLC